jgi:hypothetical protein
LDGANAAQLGGVGPRLICDIGVREGILDRPPTFFSTGSESKCRKCESPRVPPEAFCPIPRIQTKLGAYRRRAGEAKLGQGTRNLKNVEVLENYLNRNH